MFDYENGLLLAFLLWIYQTINLLVQINSRFERNLNKIGMRLSWFSLSIKNMEEGYKAKSTLRKIGKFLFVSGFGFLSIFLSWISVFFFIGSLFYTLNKNSGEPRLIKEFRWKMKNIDMNFEQILLELFKTTEQNSEQYEHFKNGFIADMLERGIA